MSDYQRDLTRLAKGGTLSTVGDFFNQFFRLLAGIFITRLFDNPATFGLYALGLRLTVFLRVIAMPGTNQGIKRFLPMYRADRNPAAVKGLLFFIIRITVILSLFVVALLLIFSPHIARLFDKKGVSSFTRILCLGIPFYVLTVVTLSALTGIYRVKYQVFIEKMLMPGMRLVILFVFLFIGSQALKNRAVLWSLPIAQAVGAALALYFFLRIFKVLRDPSVKPIYNSGKVMKFSLPLAAARPLAYLMIYIGTFIIAYFSDAADVGKYEVVTRVALLLIVPTASGIMVFAPLISELHHKKKHDELHRHYKFISKWIFTLSLFMFIVFLMFREPVMNLFGRGYSDTETHMTLAFVALAQLFNASVGPVAMMISMTGRPRINLYNNMLILVLNVTLMFILVPRFGIVGAGISQAIAVVAIKTLFLFQVWHYLKMHPFSRSYLKPLVAGLLSSGIVFVIIRLTGIDQTWIGMQHNDITAYLCTGAMISVLGVLFVFFVYILGLDEADRFILNKMFFRLRSFKQNKSTDEEQTPDNRS